MAYISFQPKDNFNTKLHTGTGSATSITGVGFQPDFVWVKQRNGTENHVVEDAVRGATKNIISHLATSRIEVVHFIFLLNFIFGKYLLFSDDLLILSQTLFSFAHKITFSFFEIIFAKAVPHAPAPIIPILYLVLSSNCSFTFHENSIFIKWPSWPWFKI